MAVLSKTFIIGPPRSGTTLVRDLLAAHPELSVHGEDFHRFHHDLSLFPDRPVAAEHFRLMTGDATETIRRAYATAIAEACAQSRHPCFVLKISTLSIQVDYLRALFPEARIVQLVRDGRDAARSMEDLRLALEAEQGRPRLLGPAPDPLGLYCAEHFADPLLRAAATWSYHVSRAFLDLRFAGPEAFLRVRYEDLLADPAAALVRIQRFIGVEPAPAVAALAQREACDLPGAPGGLGYSKTQARGPRLRRYARELSNDDRLLMAPWLEQPMRLLAYTPDPWPEREPYLALCRRRGLDPDAVRATLKREVEWVRLQVEAFAPERLLKALPVSADSALVLIEGAHVGTEQRLYDGAFTPGRSFVAKQQRRHAFGDRDGDWPRVATRLDGRTPLRELVPAERLAAALRLAQRLVDLGFLAPA